MTIELFISIVAAAAALASVVFVGLTTRHTKKQADASIAQANSAIEQTTIQRLLREEAAQPYVWADLGPDDRKGGLLVCVVGNSGPTVATGISVKVDPPLTFATTKSVPDDTWQPPFIPALAPGARLQWNLGVVHQEINGVNAQPRTITINGDGPFGPLPTLQYLVDFSVYRHNLVAAAVSDVNRLTNQLENTSKALTEAVLKVADRIPHQDNGSE